MLMMVDLCNNCNRYCDENKMETFQILAIGSREEQITLNSCDWLKGRTKHKTILKTLVTSASLLCKKELAISLVLEKKKNGNRERRVGFYEHHLKYRK